MHQRGRRFGKAPSVSWEREALGTEVERRSCGALGTALLQC